MMYFSSKYEVTKEKLLEFKKEVESKIGGVGKSSEESGGGFGGFSSSPNKPPSAAKNATVGDGSMTAQDSFLKSQIMDGLKPIWQNKNSMSRILIEETKAKEIRLTHEFKQLYKKIEEKVLLFDAELRVLRHEKGKIAVFMKNADLR